jgi:bilirubin oxidase
MLPQISLEYTLLFAGVLAYPSLVYDFDGAAVLLSKSDVNATTSAAPNTTTPTVEWVSPPYKWFFDYPLPIPPVKQPKLFVTISLKFSKS